MFKLGDKVTVSGIKSVVRYVNNNTAWLCISAEYTDNQVEYKGQDLIKGLAFTTLNSRGITPEGVKAVKGHVQKRSN